MYNTLNNHFQPVYSRRYERYRQAAIIIHSSRSIDLNKKSLNIYSGLLTSPKNTISHIEENLSFAWAGNA